MKINHPPTTSKGMDVEFDRMILSIAEAMSTNKRISEKSIVATTCKVSILGSLYLHKKSRYPRTWDGLGSGPDFNFPPPISLPSPPPHFLPARPPSFHNHPRPTLRTARFLINYFKAQGRISDSRSGTGRCEQARSSL